MAGYKVTAIDDDAVSFWTFDGDAFDSGSRKLLVPTGEPNVIIDEIDNLNPAILHNDNETYLGYRLGMPSLVDHEQTDQNSICFGFAGKQPSHPNQWAKAYLEVPNSISYAFPNFGTFSIEFVFYKKYSSDDGNLGNPTYIRPFIMKNGVFNIYYYVTLSGGYLKIEHPGGVMTIGQTIKPGFSIIDNIIHFVFVWDNSLVDNGNYQSSAKCYINGFLVQQQDYTYFDVFPNTNVDSPILICGRTGNNHFQDWHTSHFQIDQIAIYNKALTANQVATHFSKIFPYDKMIENSFPSNYWPLNDADSTIDVTVHPTVGALNGTYLGVRNSNYFRGVDGPSNLMGAKAAQFDDGGMIIFENRGNYGQYVPRTIETEYTYEFWFAVSSTKRAVLLASQELQWPFDGPLVQLNMRDNQELPGCLQFTEGDNGRVFNSKYLNTNNNRYLFNDGAWHHLVILRRPNGQLELWIDAVLHDSDIEATREVWQPGQLILMNSMPGKLNCNGSLCKLAYYPYALQEHQIQMHHTYSVTYRIRGVVTLLGVPYQATLRFYNTFTGQFIQELLSDPNTGEYEAVFYNNAGIDILVFSKADLSVRYRAYGPVTPSEFVDLPINI